MGKAVTRDNIKPNYQIPLLLVILLSFLLFSCRSDENGLSNTSGDVADTTPPGAINDLTASNPTSHSIELSWTAPGDDGGTGTVASYDIRYSTSTISDATWGSAIKVIGEPSPEAGGTTQSMIIAGLSPETTYYFAIKADDEVPNASTLSNIVAMTTSTSSSPTFNYVMGTGYFGQSSVPQPAQWESYIDPNTGISIRRITDIHKDYPQVPVQYGATIDYPRKSRSSSDGRYVLVFTYGTGVNPYKIVDLQEHTIRDAPHISSSVYSRNGGQDAQPEYRWDYTGGHPNRIYYRYGWEFYYGEVNYPGRQANSPDYNILIHNFRNDTAIFGITAASIQNIYTDTEGDSSGDSRYWCWQVRLSSGERKWVIVYDKQADGIIGKLDNNNISINFTDMAPDGSKAFVSYNYTNTKSFNLDMTGPVSICAGSAHSGWAFSLDGVAEFVQINNCGGDKIHFKNLITGYTDYLPFHQCYFSDASNGYLWNGCPGSGYLGHHIARVYPNIRGWAIFSIYDGANSYWSSNQIIAVELKNAIENPRIWRIASTQNFHGVNAPSPGGSTAPQIALSQDGTKIYFGSNWRGTDNFEVYEATLPNNWWKN